jgi:hypothetical protein
VLLILAGLAIVLALGTLAGSLASSAGSHRPPLALLGAVAALCVLYRTLDPPTPTGEFLALSPREGAWLALAGSLAIVAGAIWPRQLAAATASDAKLASAWSELSGWTPGA